MPRKNQNGGMVASSPVNSTRSSWTAFLGSRGGQTRNQMPTDGRRKDGKGGVDRPMRKGGK